MLLSVLVIVWKWDHFHTWLLDNLYVNNDDIDNSIECGRLSRKRVPSMRALVATTRRWPTYLHIAQNCSKTYSKLLITTVCPGKGKTLHCSLLVQVVQDSVQELLLLVPQIKSNISDAIAMVPEVNSFFDNSSLACMSDNWWNYCTRWRVSWRRSWTSCQLRRSCRRRRIISSPSCQTIRWEHHHMNKEP